MGVYVEITVRAGSRTVTVTETSDADDNGRSAMDALRSATRAAEAAIVEEDR